jgi:TPR repeat protein
LPPKMLRIYGEALSIRHGKLQKMKRQPWMEGAMSNSEAVRLLKIAADKRNADAQFELGFLYDSGSRGLPQDWDEAERLFMRAARQGHIGARNSLEWNAPRLPIAKWLYT